MQRVTRYVKRDPDTNALNYCPDASERDPRAIYAMYGAQKLVAAHGAVADGSSRPARAFWRHWAREVLADAGLLVLSGQDISMVPTLERLANTVIDASEEIQLADQASALRFVAGKLATRSEQLSLIPQSAERSAALYEGACILSDAAKAEGAKDDDVQNTLRAATILGKLLGDARVERLLPLAVRGRKVASGGRKGAAQVNPMRQEKAKRARAEWLAFACTLDTQLSHYGACRKVARHFGVSVETVRKALPKKPW